VAVHSPYYEIMYALGAPTQVINIIMESLILDGILAYVKFLSFIHMSCHTYGSWDLHGNNPILRVDLIVVLLLLFFVFHDLAFKGLHECEQFLALLVAQQDPDRFEAEELRQELSHILEEFFEGSLCADQGRELDAQDYLLLGDLALMVRF
jgi:hypothetical protein